MSKNPNFNELLNESFEYKKNEKDHNKFLYAFDTLHPYDEFSSKIKNYSDESNNDIYNSIYYINYKKEENNNKIINDEKTEPDSKNLIGHKINRDKDEEQENEFNEKNKKKENLTNTIKIMKNNNNQKKKQGRIKKNEIHKEEPKHNKKSDDNIIRKIKSFLFKILLKKLNDSLKDTNDIFYPLEREIKENTNKEFNEQLLKKSISDIFENTKLNKTYENKQDVHKKLIQKIKEDKNNYQETYSILSMTFQEFLTKIRNEEKEEFLEEIKNKEEKNKSNNDDDINSYMEKVEFRLDNFEVWFDEKKKRQRKQKLSEILLNKI